MLPPKCSTSATSGSSRHAAGTQADGPPTTDWSRTEPKHPSAHIAVGRPLAGLASRLRFFLFRPSHGPPTPVPTPCFTYARHEASIAREVALDGLYVLRTNLPAERLDAPGVVLAYKSLAHVERAFRHCKLSGLEVRPIFHYTEPRARAHLLLCLLAYWVQRELQRALATPAVCGRGAPGAARPRGAGAPLGGSAAEGSHSANRRGPARAQLPDPPHRLGHPGEKPGRPPRWRPPSGLRSAYPAHSAPSTGLRPIGSPAQRVVDRRSGPRVLFCAYFSLTCLEVQANG